MSWVYEQSTGRLYADGGELVGVGYSGQPDHKNDPNSQHIHNEGPIPAGDWKVTGQPINTESHGPFVLHLTPGDQTDTFGRMGFLIHGDSVKAPGTASEGCIIMSRDVREKVWGSGDRELKVVASLPAEITPST